MKKLWLHNKKESIFLLKTQVKNISRIRKFKLEKYKEHSLYKQIVVISKRYEAILFKYVEAYWEGFNKTKSIAGFNDTKQNENKSKSAFFVSHYGTAKLLFHIIMDSACCEYDSADKKEKQRIVNTFQSNLDVLELFPPIILNSHNNFLWLFNENMEGFIKSISELQRRINTSKRKNMLTEDSQSLKNYKGVIELKVNNGFSEMKACEEFRKQNGMGKIDSYKFYQGFERWKSRNLELFNEIENSYKNKLTK
jgi:hypothetical protein